MAKTLAGKVIESALGPAGALIGSIFSSKSRDRGARIQAETAREINAKQLAFQQKMWEQTNAYNTPANQMNRFLEAGLNPNLMYGRGDSGNAGMLSTPDLNVPDDAAAYEARAEIFPNALNHFASIAQSSLLTARQKNVEQDTANKAIDGAIKATRSASDELSYKQKQDTYNTVVETAKKNLARINQDIDLKQRKDSREERVVNETVRKISEEIKNLQKKGKILSEDEIIRRIDREMYEAHKIRPQDPYYLRIFGEIFDAINGLNPTPNRSIEFWQKRAEYRRKYGN